MIFFASVHQFIVFLLPFVPLVDDRQSQEKQSDAPYYAKCCADRGRR